MCRVHLPVSLICMCVIAGCQPASDGSNSEHAVQDSSRPAPDHPQLPDREPAMQLSSTAFAEGGAIPEKYTGVGQDISPPLTWSDPPEQTRSLAIVCDDPDAPSRDHPRPEGPWVHWVIYNLPASMRGLAEGLPRKAEPPSADGARQGRNDFGSDNVGYRGPMPPPGSGPHRYVFQIYALDCPLEVPAGTVSKKTVLAAMKDHILATGRLVGTFERK